LFVDSEPKSLPAFAFRDQIFVHYKIKNA